MKRFLLPLLCLLTGLSGAAQPTPSDEATALIRSVSGQDFPVHFLPSDEDGYTVDVRQGQVTIIARDPVFGAAGFLERCYGAVYFGGGEFYVPAHRKGRIPADGHFTLSPTFSYRQTQSYRIGQDPLFRRWYGLSEPEEVFAADLWVHTFNKILPSAEYGETHPEYYAFYNGTRHPGDGTQWCLSNPELLELVCHKVDSLFRAHPDRDIISLSQNDGTDTYCRCPECMAADEAEGSHAGSLIRFVNAVAERFPDKKIATLAYLYTMEPPKLTRPRDNVVVMLCDIDCMREQPLDGTESGRWFLRCLEGWSAITKELFVWDYGINFDCYLAPFPNLRVMAANMKIFRDNHVKMHFSQIGGGYGGDITELRSFVAAKLMQDADADLDSLGRVFHEAYFGPAARPMDYYLRLRRKALEVSGKQLWIYDSPVTHKDGMLSERMRKRYNELFDEAEAAVADDPVRLRRVRMARLPLQYSELEIARCGGRLERPVEETLHLFETRCKEFGVTQIDERESNTLEYCELYRQRWLGTATDNLSHGKSVRYIIPPHRRYEKEARTALTDGLYGGYNYVETWIGWEGTDGELVLDLGSEQDIRRVSSDFLVKLGAWILLPLQVSYATSTDGKTFRDWATLDVPSDRDLSVRFVPVTATSDSPIRARYVRVHITGTRECPDWHYGAGNPSWFFIDEITVE